MNSEYMTSGQLLFWMFVIGFILFFLMAGRWPFVEFWRWLKGSRKRYYLSPEGVLRFRPVTYFLGSITDLNEIEIAKGPFRFRLRRAICGLASKSWQLVQANLNDGGGGVIELRDKQGVVLEDALRLINTYPSLQAMLDRIAELDKKLVQERNRCHENTAVLEALNMKILKDKQRFRSPAVKEIHANIRFAQQELNGRFTQQSVDSWLGKFASSEASVIQ